MYNKITKYLRFNLVNQNEEISAQVFGEKTSPVFTVKFQLNFTGKSFFVKGSVENKKIRIFEKKGLLQKILLPKSQLIKIPS